MHFTRNNVREGITLAKIISHNSRGKVVLIKCQQSSSHTRCLIYFHRESSQSLAVNGKHIEDEDENYDILAPLRMTTNRQHKYNTQVDLQFRISHENSKM